jgi:hypothetical protein
MWDDYEENDEGASPQQRNPLLRTSLILLLFLIGLPLMGYLILIAAVLSGPRFD